MTHAQRILIVTAGTGASNDRETTLYQPILKSVEYDHDQRELVVLLPSQATQPYAEEIKRRIAGQWPHLAVEIYPLPQADQENNADACFSHFDQVISRLRDRNFAPRNVCVDFTRGTRAMSAAAVLAAFRHDIPFLRYIEGDRDPNRQSNVVPGTEHVCEIRTASAAASKLLDSVHLLFTKGAFAAAHELLKQSDASAPELPAMLNFLRGLAELYNAWDRLDYCRAHKLANSLPAKPAGSAFWNDCWLRFALDENARSWLEELACAPPKNTDRLEPEAGPKMAAHARRLCADLLANGERRIRDRQYEDANLRAYRIAEMLGQIRLFERGYDSSALDLADEKVKQFQEELKLETTQIKGRECCQVGRQQAYRFLKRLGDSFWEKLRDLDQDIDRTITRRNQSILIHGFEPLAIHDESLHSTYRQLERLILEDGESVGQTNLQRARFLNFGFSIE
jgi:CRISPR-associated protein (TIGR02710 family)